MLEPGGKLLRYRDLHCDMRWVGMCLSPYNWKYIYGELESC